MKKVLFAILATFFLLQSGAHTQSADEKDRIRELERKVEEFQKELDRLRSQSSSPEVEELRRQLAVLAEEVEKLRSGEEEITIEDAQQTKLKFHQ